MYPYTAFWLGDGSPAKDQQLKTATQEASSPTGDRSPSSVGARSLAAGWLRNYEPKKLSMTYDPSFEKPSSVPLVPSHSTGFDSPAVQPKLVSSTSENPYMGSDGPASSPVHEDIPLPRTSYSTYPINMAGDTSTTFMFDAIPAPVALRHYGAAPYECDPAAFSLCYTPVLYVSPPAAFSFAVEPAHYYNAPAAFSFGDEPFPYISAPAASIFQNRPAFYASAPAASTSDRFVPATSKFWDVPSPHIVPVAPRFGDRLALYGDQTTADLPPRDEQSAEEADAAYDGMPSHHFLAFGNSEVLQSKKYPPLSSSYARESGNAYRGGREVHSDMKHTTEHRHQPSVPSGVDKVPNKTP